MRGAVWLCVVLIGGCGAGKTIGGDDPPPADEDTGPSWRPPAPPDGSPPGDPGDPDLGDPEPDPPEPWTLDVDVSGLDRFVVGAPATWPLRGRATASLGLDRVEVAGAPATLAPDGSFHADVPVSPGLHLLPIEAYDAAMPEHRRKAHRALVSARFLPEGELNAGAASITLSDPMLAAMAEPLTAEVAAVDVAGEIMRRSTLSNSMGCVTYPAYASHEPPALALFEDGRHELWVRVTIPSLYIAFTGSCSVLLANAPIEGEILTDVVIYSRLSPLAGGGCVSGFDHTEPYVELPGFDVDVRGTGLLTGFLVSLAASMREGSTREEFRVQLATQADGLLGERLRSIRVFDRNSTMELLGRTVSLQLCLTDLRTDEDTLRAVIGATAAGGGTTPAPGAPQVEGELPPTAPTTLWLDANLVSQLLFSSWRAGGLDNDALMELPIGTLALLNRSLRRRFPDGSSVTVSLAGELPPFVQASASDGGDLSLDIGDLMIDLKVAGELLYRVGAMLHVVLELVPEGNGLRPRVASISPAVHVLAEPAGDVPDDVLETVVSSRVGEAAGALLDGATIALPEIAGAGRPRAVTAVPGGRYLAIALE